MSYLDRYIDAAVPAVRAVPLEPVARPERRRCADCPTILRRTNTGDRCAICDARLELARREKVRARGRLLLEAERQGQLLELPPDPEVEPEPVLGEPPARDAPRMERAMWAHEAREAGMTLTQIGDALGCRKSYAGELVRVAVGYERRTAVGICGCGGAMDARARRCRDCYAARAR